jgi:hypothetical protein
MSIAVAFLQGIAGGILVILFFIVIIGGLLFATVFGRAFGGSRGPDRPPGEPERSLLPARILCATGLGFAVIGAFFISLGTNVVGLVLGLVGYYLGARVFGVVVIVLSTITLFIGPLIGPGVIPGSYDKEVNGVTKTHEK